MVQVQDSDLAVTVYCQCRLRALGGGTCQCSNNSLSDNVGIGDSGLEKLVAGLRTTTNLTVLK